jgi:hypothetical protein
VTVDDASGQVEPLDGWLAWAQAAIEYQPDPILGLERLSEQSNSEYLETAGLCLCALFVSVRLGRSLTVAKALDHISPSELRDADEIAEGLLRERSLPRSPSR